MPYPHHLNDFLDAFKNMTTNPGVFFSSERTAQEETFKGIVDLTTAPIPEITGKVISLDCVVTALKEMREEKLV